MMRRRIMKVSKKAQNELRQLLELAVVRYRQAVEVERTSSASFALPSAMADLGLDIYALGSEAFFASEKDRWWWEDGFTGTLYSLSKAVEDAITNGSEVQVNHLRELAEIIETMDVWHTKHVAS
jgi:hypothetical protein